MRLGSSSPSQVRGAATVGVVRPRSEYGAIVVLAALFCDQSRNTRPSRAARLMFAVTAPGMALTIVSAICRAQSLAAAEVIGSSNGMSRCRPFDRT